jgi:hypothetical protein
MLLEFHLTTEEIGVVTTLIVTPMSLLTSSLLSRRIQGLFTAEPSLIPHRG